MYLIKILRLDPSENSWGRAAFYEVIGVTNDAAVRAFFEGQYANVSPNECWALAGWPHPIRRIVLEPIETIGTVTQAKTLLRERGFKTP